MHMMLGLAHNFRPKQINATKTRKWWSNLHICTNDRICALSLSRSVLKPIGSFFRYIEEQLTKRKSNRTDNDNDNDASYAEEKYLSPEEAALLSLPEHLRVGSAHRSEEMLSNQMLNGIPEVDLGIDAKIRNIEATEAAKEKLLMEQKNKKDAPSHFVPTNMAVNFVQHNRCECIRLSQFDLINLVTICAFQMWFQLISTTRSREDDDSVNKNNRMQPMRRRVIQSIRESKGQPTIIIMTNSRNNFDVIKSNKKHCAERKMIVIRICAFIQMFLRNNFSLTSSSWLLYVCELAGIFILLPQQTERKTEK